MRLGDLSYERYGGGQGNYESLMEFITKCGMSESVKELITARVQTEKLKQKFEQAATDRWGGGQLNDMLGGYLMSMWPSKGLLTAIKVLAKEVEDIEEAREPVSAAWDRRLGLRGSNNDRKLRVDDVKAAINGSDD